MLFMAKCGWPSCDVYRISERGESKTLPTETSIILTHKKRKGNQGVQIFLHLPRKPKRLSTLPFITISKAPSYRSKYVPKQGK